MEAAAGRLVVCTGAPGDADVEALLRAAAETRFEAVLVAPTSSVWDASDPAVVAAASAPSRLPVVLAGHGAGVYAAFGTYRHLDRAVGIIGLRGGTSLPAGACRLEVGSGDDVYAACRPWLERITRWHGPAAVSDAEAFAALSRGVRGERQPGDPDPAELLLEIGTFHASNRFIEHCCAHAAREAADPALRCAAAVTIATKLSDRWYGISERAKSTFYELSRDDAVRAAHPDFERVKDAFLYNTMP